MKFRNKYSIQFKLKCLYLVKIVGIYRTSIIIGIDKKCIRCWNLNKEKFENIVKTNVSHRLPGAGCKLKCPDIQEKIMLFITKCKERGINLTMNLIIQEYCRICTEKKNCSKSTLRKWYYRFLKKNNITIKDLNIKTNFLYYLQ